VRAHANYAENMPIFLILLALLELAGGNKWALWGAGIAFILARIVHAFGMDGPTRLRLRVVGMMVGTLVLIGLAAYAIFIGYRSPPISGGGIQIGPGRTAQAPAPPAT
jgi:uncharacterized protein